MRFYFWWLSDQGDDPDDTDGSQLCNGTNEIKTSKFPESIIYIIFFVMMDYNHISNITILNLMVEALILSSGWFFKNLAITLFT